MSELANEQFSKLLNYFSHKEKYSLMFTSNSNDFVTQFQTPIQLNQDRNYEIGLTWFSGWNTIFNVDASNNQFVYTHNGNQWTTLTITPGAYELTALSNTIKSMMQANNHWNEVDNIYNIELGVNLSTSRAIIFINHANYKVDFTRANSIRTLLGFNPQILSAGQNVGDSIVQITNLMTINIECDICEGSYFNGKLGSILYSFPSYTTPVGSRFTFIISNPIYLPVSKKLIERIRIRMIDEDGNLINFNNEELSLMCQLREI